MDNIYNKKNISIYGLDFLLKNVYILTPYLLEYGENNIEAFKYIYSSKVFKKAISNNIDISFLVYNNYSLDIIKRIEKELYDVPSVYINKIYKLLKEFVEIISNNNKYNAYKLITATCISNDLLIYFDKYYLYFNDTLFLDFCSKYIINSGLFLSAFISFYNAHKSLISSLDINDLKTQKYLTIWLRNSSIDINSKEELSTIVDKRKQLLIAKIEDKNISNRLRMQLIVTTLFNVYIQNFEKEVVDFMNMKDYLPRNIIYQLDKIGSLLKTDNVNDFIKYINIFYDFDNFFITIESYAKQESAKSISSNLYIKPGTNIVNLNGEPFSILVHKLTGYSDEKTYKSIKHNISKWDSLYDSESIISMSLINQYNMATIPGRQSILTFDNIDYRRIIDMGPCDLYSVSKRYQYGIKNSKSRIMFYSDFIRICTNGYNEIVLKRYMDGVNLVPNGVLTFNNIKIHDQELANYFKIPIYVINLNTYITKMLDHLEYLITNNMIEDFDIYSHQFLYSFIDNKIIIKKNFGDEYIKKILTSLIGYYSLISDKQYKIILKENINKVIDVFVSLSSIKEKNGINNDFLSVADIYRNKVRRL